MKRFINLLFFLALFSFLRAQPNLTSSEWQEDLRFLQEKVHREYSFLFHKITPEKWDAQINSLHSRIPKMADHEVMVGIAEVVAAFGYGHTALWLSSSRYDRLVPFHQLPLNLYWFTDGIYIQGAHQDYPEAVGAKVVKVGQFDIMEAVEAIQPVMSAENDQFLKAHGLYYLSVPEVLHAKGIIDNMEAVTYTLEKDGKRFTQTFIPRPSERAPGHYGLILQNNQWLEARQQETTPLWLKNLERKFSFEYLPAEKIAYVRQSEVQDMEEESLEAFYSRVFEFIEQNDVEKLILDLRLNSGGNNYKNKPVITGLIKCEKINQPGKLFAILGRRTFSACQNLVNELENYTEVTFVGEPTGENVNFFGDSRTEKLPNSQLPIRLSYLWWQDKDPRDKRPWTSPHIPVELSFNDYFTNHDPVLETIKTALAHQKPVDPMTYLGEQFEAGNLEEVKRAAKEFAEAPQYRFYDFEYRLNDAGYQLMGIDRVQEALFVFQLTAELYPESARSWRSLGEALWRAGDPDQARIQLQKAIDLDREGTEAEKAQKILELME